MGVEQITKRELAIIKLLAEDLTSRQIGEKLKIAEGTVTSHRNSIMKKLEVNSKDELIRVAIRENLIS